MVSKIDEARQKLEYVHNMNECNKIMGQFQHYLSQNKMVELLGLWSKRPDSSLQALWGCYDGYEGVERCFMVDFGDRRDPRNKEALAGYMYVHATGGEMITIAEDRQTARGKWGCWGANVLGKVARKGSDKGVAYWNQNDYGVDFIRENDKWKIWHMLEWPQYYTPYDKCWDISDPYTQFPLRKTTEDRPPLRPIYNYSLDAVYTYMPVPAPYKTFADVAPGYGYLDDNGNVIEWAVHNELKLDNKRR
jgi:hypothetical protein